MSESRDPHELAVDAAPADAAAQLDPRRWAALIVILLAAFMDVVDVPSC